MKDILGKIFACIFKIISFCSSINHEKVSFIMTHDDKFNGNLKYIYEEIKRNYPNYKINIISKKDYDIDKSKNFLSLVKQSINVFLKKNYDLATSKYIFLNNIFITGAYISFKKEVKVIQVWHAIGTFKKFGEEYNPNYRINELQKKANAIYTDVVVCSKKDIDVYSKAFNIEKDKVKAFGSPCCDLFNNKDRIMKIQKKIYYKYSKIKCKKVYLYTPTFRDRDEENLKIINYVDKISKSLNSESILLVRLHPHIYKKYKYKFHAKNVIDVSGYDDAIELMTVTDVLITDYSSIFYEFSYLEKPIIFFSFDLEKYECERGFYYNYRRYVPGEIVYSIEQLVDKLNKDKIINKSIEFKKYYFDYLDGKCNYRIINYYFKNN